MEVIGFRFAATGVFGYDFYQNGCRLCAVSSLVVPSPTVNIQGFGGAWQSPFDADSTLFPGLTRFVYRAGSAREACRLVYRGEGYDLHCGTDVYSVHMRDGAYAVYAGAKKIADVARLTRPQAAGVPVPPDMPYDDGEAYYAAGIAEGLPDDVMMAVLAFPMLRFDG